MAILVGEKDKLASQTTRRSRIDVKAAAIVQVVEPLFTDKELMDELYTPLVRDLVLPETFVPNKYSATQKMIDGCLDYFDKIDGFGGMVEAVEAGFPQREIQESAYQYQKAVERNEQSIVGVNKYAMDSEIHKTDILQIDETVRDHQLERLARTKANRDNGAVSNSLERLKKAAADYDNTMPAIIEAVAAYATVEEICVALRDVYGIYEEPAF